MKAIVTKRLVLRDFEKADWRAVQDYASDPEVVRYVDFGPNTEEESRNFIQRALASQKGQPRNNFSLAVILKAKNALIGGCGIYVSNPANREGYIGYVLNRNFWKLGYATETVQALVKFGFKELKLHRIFATCDAENLASAHVMEKVGMQREAHFRENGWVKGKWRDSLLYAILEGEWKKSKPSKIEYQQGRARFKKQIIYTKHRRHDYAATCAAEMLHLLDVGVEMKKILFVSGSIGLGHVGRDLEIAGALRKIRPDVEISWMAEPPASGVLESAGEKLLPEAGLLSSANAELEGLAKEYKANLVQWVMNMRKGWSQNAEVYARISQAHSFDLWIGDEPYDIMIAMQKNPGLKKCPFVVIYDFLGLDATTRNPVDHLAAYMTNRLWVKFLVGEPSLADRSIFVGEIEDVPDKRFGFMLPNRRRLAGKLITFAGYVLPEDIEDFRNKAEARKLLGYGNEPLILCSIGGTSAGKNLLDLCVKAYPIVKDKIPNLQMVLVCGPRVAPDSIQTPAGVKIVGYLPSLYRHLGAADLCIVTGGGTITLELTALQRPFLYFPLEHHFEQEVDVANRCQRHRAGIRMTCSKTTPESLSEAIVSNIGTHVDYASIPTNGAQEAARTIQSIL